MSRDDATLLDMLRAARLIDMLEPLAPQKKE